VERERTEVEISHAAYGKDGVRVLTWSRGDGIDTVRDARVSVRVEGDFLASYVAGDNAAILPSDTLRRHALAAADADPAGAIEALLAALADRILAANPALIRVVASAETREWRRIGDHSFVLGPWRGSADARLDRTGVARLRGGVRGLELLSTTGSGFTGFMRDDLTTQAEASDRPLCGTLDADWTYREGRRPAAGSAATIVGRLTAAFADRPSNAVQQLLTDIGRDVLGTSGELATISLHFESIPAAPIPAGLSAPGAGSAHELGVGAVGATDVALRRA
jgi:urate oxidase